MPQVTQESSQTRPTPMPISDKALAIAQLIRRISLKTGRSFYLATAESCTGGQVASALTSVPGASEWFHTGVVTYTVESKRKILSIDPQILSAGLVTEETAKAMAEGVAKLSGADYALSTTGVAGPSPSEGKDPLTVWIGIRTPLGTTAKLFQAKDKGRTENQTLATLEALTSLEAALFRDFSHIEGRDYRGFFA